MKKTATTILLTAIILIAGVQNSMAQRYERFESKKDGDRTGVIHQIRNTAINQNTAMLKVAADNDLTEALEQYWSSEDSDWMDAYKEVYSYSEDRLTITKTSYYWDGGWLAAGSSSVTFNEDGLPLQSTEEEEDWYESTQVFHYSEEGRLDSVTYDEVWDGDVYVDRTYFEYVTEDSILVSGYYEDGDGREDYDTSIIVQKDGNLSETYIYEDWQDRYTYYGIDLDGLLRWIFDELLLLEEYNDEFYPNDGWVPYSRDYFSIEDDTLTQLTTDYWEDEWITEYRIDQKKNSGVVDSHVYTYFYEGMWNYDYRTLFSYGPATSVEDEEVVANFQLNQNYPNPFNPSTTISFNLATSENVTLKVFNVLGKEVATLVSGVKAAGMHTVQFDASALPTGLYYYTLQTPGVMQTRSMTLIK